MNHVNIDMSDPFTYIYADLIFSHLSYSFFFFYTFKNLVVGVATARVQPDPNPGIFPHTVLFLD